MSDTMDYQAMLADMEAKKASLEQAIASLRAALAAGALGQPGEFVAGSGMGPPIELPVGILSNKSVPAAILLYLSAVKKKQTVQQIATALREGGVESTASNFEKVVTGTLWRLKEAKKVLKLKDGSWGLTELYPEHIRKAMFEDKEQNSPRKKAKKKTIKTKEKSEASGKAASVIPISKGNGLGKKIDDFLASHGQKPFLPAEIAKSLEANSSAVSMMLGQMVSKGKVEKVEDGKYRLKVTTQKAV